MDKYMNCNHLRELLDTVQAIGDSKVASVVKNHDWSNGGLSDDPIRSIEKETKAKIKYLVNRFHDPKAGRAYYPNKGGRVDGCTASHGLASPSGYSIMFGED